MTYSVSNYPLFVPYLIRRKANKIKIECFTPHLAYFYPALTDYTNVVLPEHVAWVEKSAKLKGLSSHRDSAVIFLTN